MLDKNLWGRYNLLILMDILTSPIEFEWDKHNAEHIKVKHNIQPGDCEQVFFNVPFTIKPDTAHSLNEERYFASGKTNTSRVLVMVFTIRRKKIRIITARDANRKERGRHE